MNETGPGRSANRARTALQLYGKAVRTALGNNSTAYGFSVSITATYGLLNGVHGSASALETLGFALGAAGAFVGVALVLAARFRGRTLNEDEITASIAGLVDLVSLMAAVGVAVGASRVPGSIAWVLCSFLMTLTYLVVGGLDVLLAQRVARKT